MHRALSLAPALVLAACSQEAAAPTQSAEPAAIPSASMSPRQASLIPERFLGIWDAKGGNCDPNSDLRVEIAERGVTFYESHGAVTRVTVESPASVVVDLAMQGEGETWTVKRRFTLSKDGQSMTPAAVDDDQQALIPRQRCK